MVCDPEQTPTKLKSSIHIWIDYDGIKIMGRKMADPEFCTSIMGKITVFIIIIINKSVIATMMERQES